MKKKPRFDPDGKIICDDCGKSFESLTRHVCKIHGYRSAYEYKQVHGYAVRFGLVGEKTRAKISTSTYKRGLDKLIVEYGRDFQIKPGTVWPDHPRYKTKKTS